MYQRGVFDFWITPRLHRALNAYDRTPAPKYYVGFALAGHFAWTNLGIGSRDAIVRYSLAFMNRYVKGEPADALLTHAGPGVAMLRFDGAEQPSHAAAE